MTRRLREVGKYPMKNPTVPKTWKDVGLMLASSSQADRNHAYCSPRCCQYYGIYKNCDGTLRSDITDDSQYICLSPSYGEIAKSNVVPEGVAVRGRRKDKDNG